MIKAGVLFFGSIYERTGAGKVVKSFKESESIFREQGIEISLFSLDNGSREVPQKARGNMIDRLKYLINQTLKKSAWGSFFLINHLYYGKGIKVIKRCWDGIAEQDVLIFHEIYTCYAYLNKCKRHHAIMKPYMLVLHTNGEILKMDKIYYPKLDGSRYMRALLDRADSCMRHAKRISFVSQMSVDTFKRLSSQYAGKAQMVYNGISPLPVENFPVFDGSIRMVTVGTVNARKNQIMLVRVMGLLKDKHKINLTVVGGGDKLDECESLAKSLEVDNKIEFLGGRDDIPDILSKCNLFVMSSYDEGLPISAIEALRSGLPVILTDVGGNKELIERNGYLIEPTEDSLINAIEEFAKSVEMQKNMSNMSRKLFKERFCTNKMIEGYCELLKMILE